MNGSLSMVLVLAAASALAACAPEGTPLAAPISRFEGETFVLEGEAYTMAELDGVTAWARLERARAVPIAALPSEHASVGEVVALSPTDVLALSGGAVLALDGDRFTIAGAVDDGGPPPADLCGRDETGAIWALGTRTVDDPEPASPYDPTITESRLLRFEGTTFTSEALPEALAETYADCWMAEGDIWALPSDGLTVYQRTASGWVEHAPWSDAPAPEGGRVSPRVLTIGGRPYVDTADQLWERRDGEWIAHPLPSALPNGSSLYHSHMIAASAPDDVVVAQGIYSEVCVLFGCGSRLERVDLYRFDGSTWSAIASVPALEVEEEPAVPELDPTIVRLGPTHLWLDDDGAHLLMGGRVHYGPL